MTTKEQILQELEQMPEPMMVKVLEYIQSLKVQDSDVRQGKVWQAYLASEKEREEVYRRLADS